MINKNGGIYLGTVTRRGWRARVVKVGETSDLHLRQYQLNKSEDYEGYRHIATYTPQGVEDKPTRLLYEAVARYVIAKNLNHSGNDRFEGDLKTEEVIALFNEAMQLTEELIAKVPEGR